MNSILSLTISAVSDFVLAAGGCLIAGMSGAESTALPSYPVLLIAAVTGLMAMARTLKATTDKPMTTTKTTETTPSGAVREVMTSAPSPKDPPKGAST
jgi:hypothetical protein